MGAPCGLVSSCGPYVTSPVQQFAFIPSDVAYPYCSQRCHSIRACCAVYWLVVGVMEMEASLGTVVSVTKKHRAEGALSRRDEPDLGQRLARVLVVASQHLLAVGGIDGAATL